MADLGKAYIQIVPSAEGITGAISNVLDGEAQSAGSTAGMTIAGKIKSAIVDAGIGKAMGDVIKASLSEGASLEQSIGGVETLFKESADEVKKNAEIAFQTAGMSANDYMETVTGFSASLLQGLNGDTAKAASVADMAIRDMSDNANKFGTDIESIQNAYSGFAKQNYTMLDNLKLGYGGTAAEMARLINESGVMNDGIKYTAQTVKDVPLDKIMEGIHKIQENMDITGTTAREAADTFEGSMSSMKAAASNLLGKLALGESIGPSLKELGESVRVFINSNLLPMLANILSQIPEMIGFLFTTIIQEINIASHNTDEFVAGFINFISKIAVEILQMTPYLLEAIWNLVSNLFQSLVNFDWLTWLNGLGETIQSDLSLMLGEIFGADTFGEALTGITSGAREIIESLSEGVRNGLPVIAEQASELIPVIVTMIDDGLPQILESGVEIILVLVKGIIDSLPSIIESAVKILKSLIDTLLENLPKILETALKIVAELAAGLLKAIPDLVKSALELLEALIETIVNVDWLEVGKNIVLGIKDGLVAAGSILWDAAKEMAAGVLDVITDFLKIGSPSKLMADEVGKWIPAGIALGVQENFDPLSGAIEEMGEMSLGILPETMGSETMQKELRINNEASHSEYEINIHIHSGGQYDEEKLAKKVVQEIIDQIDRGKWYA